MEYVESGTLHDCIQTSDEMSESTIRHIISQILSALEYMHERVRVSHRDLKPAVPTFCRDMVDGRTFFWLIAGNILLSKSRIWVLQKSRLRRKITLFVGRQGTLLRNVLRVLKLQD
jgi:serine/threonine protein kinase